MTTTTYDRTMDGFSTWPELRDHIWFDLRTAEAARERTQFVLLLLGTQSPAWATDVTQGLVPALARNTVVPLHGTGHEAVDDAPHAVAEQLRTFLLAPLDTADPVS